MQPFEILHQPREYLHSPMTVPTALFSVRIFQATVLLFHVLIIRFMTVNHPKTSIVHTGNHTAPPKIAKR